MARVAWTLTDHSTGTADTLEFEINPNEFEPPSREATLNAMQTTAPSGSRIIFGGGDAVPEGQMRGAVNTQAFYGELQTWFNKWWPLVLTDDLGNSYTILISSVNWTRLRRAINPHRYDYTVRFLLLS